MTTPAPAPTPAPLFAALTSPSSHQHQPSSPSSLPSAAKTAGAPAITTATPNPESLLNSHCHHHDNYRNSNSKDQKEDERVILHFDYDCFYASVCEQAEPSLRGRPLGVRQKSLLATCNYAARARGVRKLMPVAAARRLCPDLALRAGEDLAPFRTASARLYAALAPYAWGRHRRRVERLGLDEVFLDATAIVDYNQALLPPAGSSGEGRKAAFFHLAPDDPEKGFLFDATRFCGHVHSSPLSAANAELAVEQERPENEKDGKGDGTDLSIAVPDPDDPTQVRLMLGSHLAGYLRQRLEADFGYTSSGGVATNKALAKLAGSAHKPRAQTTLLPLRHSNHCAVQAFLDAHPLRKIPGIGSRIGGLIREHMLTTATSRKEGEAATEPPELEHLTVGDVRRHPGMSPAVLSRILDKPGLARGLGATVWGLLHGADPSEVKKQQQQPPTTTESGGGAGGVGAPLPTQVSVEDTYMARPLNTPAELVRELHALAASLVRRMRADLTTTTTTTTSNTNSEGKNNNGSGGDDETKRKWLARPRTLRLSTRAHPRGTGSNSSGGNNTHNNNGSSSSNSFARSTRSQPLPSFALDLGRPSAEVADRLAQEALLPLFRRLHPPRPSVASTLSSVAERKGSGGGGRVGVGVRGGNGGGGGSGGWNLVLLNVGVTNMVVVANDTDGDAHSTNNHNGSNNSHGGGGSSSGGVRDISRMFRTQEGRLREWTAYNDDSAAAATSSNNSPPRPSAPPPPLSPSHYKDGRSNSDAPCGGDMATTTVDEAGMSPIAEYGKVEYPSHEGEGQATSAVDPATAATYDSSDAGDSEGEGAAWEDDNGDADEGDSGMQRCPLCGLALPVFAVAAHERFHAMGGD